MRRFGALLVILHRYVFAGVVRHHGRGYQAHHRAGRDVNGDRVVRVISGEQSRRDQLCGAAGNDRCQLVAE